MVADEAAEAKQRWMADARRLILKLDLGKYADFRFKSWDENRNGGSSARAVRDVRSYVDGVIHDQTRHWLYLCGPYGTGKTHLAIAALRQIAAEKLWKPVVVVWPQHCSQVKESWHMARGEAGPSERQLWGEVRQAGILLIDDLDKAAPTPWAIQKLYEIIDYRVINRKPVIITANRRLEQIADFWVDTESKSIKDTGGAILSRMAGELCRIVEFGGVDQRWAGKQNDPAR
jgi:DNA replication protein DnaC